MTGFEPKNNLCLPICGDNILVGYEICDDGNNGACSSDCSSVNAGYECSIGSSSYQS